MPAAEKEAEEKYAYFNGQVPAMYRAGMEHTRISGNIFRHTGSYLQKRQLRDITE